MSPAENSCRVTENSKLNSRWSIIKVTSDSERKLWFRFCSIVLFEVLIGKKHLLCKEKIEENDEPHLEPSLLHSSHCSSRLRLQEVGSRRVEAWRVFIESNQDPCLTQNLLLCLRLSILTRISSSPLSSRLQNVLGPLPLSNVCLQWILFSRSQVARLCQRAACNQVSLFASVLVFVFFYFTCVSPAGCIHQSTLIQLIGTGWWRRKPENLTQTLHLNQ